VHRDVMDLPIVRVYIDETGDRGFGARSSPVFGISAVMIPDEHDHDLRTAVGALRTAFGITGAVVHWSDHCGPSYHDRRRHVARTLASVPGVQVLYALIDKQHSPDSSAMRTDHRLAYNYVARLVFERAALAARDWPGGPRRAVVRVAHVRGHDHHELLRYIQHRCPRLERSSWIPWALAVSSVRIDSPKRCDGLQAADLYCGIFNAAVSPDRFGYVDDGHLLTVAHQIRRGPCGQILGFGIKILGQDPRIVVNQPWWPALHVALAA
jgi:Protein of unknown function (DUF3800)